jgi:hypothetical protein
MKAKQMKSNLYSQPNLRGNIATVEYLVTSLSIARTGEIMVRGKVLEIRNLPVVSNAENLVMLRPISSS